MSRRPLRLFSIVYNERYVDWFARGCVNSLLWPQNKRALQSTASSWDLWTVPADETRVHTAAQRVGIPINVHLLEPHDEHDGTARKENLKRALMHVMDACQDSGAFLWLAPDSIFGDGTIRSIIEVGAVPGLCVALAPMRVIADGFLEAMPRGPMSNAELVRMAFERMHRGFREANATLPETNSYISGVSWRQIGDGLYAVTHLQHSAYLMQPTKGDAKWFRNMNKFGAYDHSLPKRLVADQRQRVIGSSDAAFVAELTPEAGNTPKLRPSDPAHPDKYDNEEHQHHSANRNVVCIWRAA